MNHFLPLLASLALALGSCLAPAQAANIDLNRASVQQLQQVRGIGPAMAQRIVAARRERPFASFDDFRQRVPGIGPVRARQFREAGLGVKGGPDGQERPAAPLPMVKTVPIMPRSRWMDTQRP